MALTSEDESMMSSVIDYLSVCLSVCLSVLDN